MYVDPDSGLTLPQGVVLAPVGRRVGAYFLSIVLAIVTLGIGFLIWGAILWGRGTSPAFSVLGMRCWDPQSRQVVGWWRMALRDIVGAIVESVLGIVTALISFVLMLVTPQHRSARDFIGGTVVVYDPNKVLDRR
jgi:uncharacterized RDD family membrane protein YckC